MLVKLFVKVSNSWPRLIIELHQTPYWVLSLSYETKLTRAGELVYITVHFLSSEIYNVLIVLFAVGRIWAFGVYVVIATTGMPLHFCFLWECWSLYSPQTLGVIRGCSRLTLSWASTVYLLPSDAWEHFSAFVEVHGLSVMEQLCSRVTFPRSKSYLHVPFGLSHGWPEKVWELLYLDSSVVSS